MSKSNRSKSHSEGSDRHLNEPVQELLHSVQRKILENASTNPPRSDELLEHPQKVPEGGVNSEIIQWIEYTIVQTPNKKYKGIAQQKEREKKGRSPSSFQQQATSQPTS
ncbi:hypothetical protein O181_113019 [Austropuccinia psidii MF-1]|uniref:Uncharacterized protein n=1 Tax=Austropuccinia psidii MF-1 TaxID=1389203 RepID=A0A9Q3PTA0_9BASI|nr:hypothetical protein [Austropuccinia psidii MF-1]